VKNLKVTLKSELRQTTDEAATTTRTIPTTTNERRPQQQRNNNGELPLYSLHCKTQIFTTMFGLKGRYYSGAFNALQE
jgi:phosphate-selective porin